ncbi:MAG: D-inositol 3-phosphate glycosyltransferase [Elusimicrobia bacterium ADurb.Bin231]|nr:MAG: D-inositol 3-phosphate glycosyltransferase [Elusimicrobia bacterium ADurb.Bin231]
MRIAYNGRYLSHPNMTGVERVAYNILKNIMKIDQKNEYIVFLENKKYFKDCSKNGNTRLIECNMLEGGTLNKYFWEQTRLGRLAYNNRCDILFNPANTGPVFSVINSVLMLCDVSFLVNPAWFSRRFRYVYGILIPLVARKALKIITISQSSKNEIMKYLSIDQDKISVVNPAIDTVFDTRISANSHKMLAELNINRPYILFVGSIEPRKNIAKLMQAYRSIKEKNYIPHELVIVGSGHTNFADAGIELLNGIKCLGYLSDTELKTLYQNAEAFVYPSLYEGFGLPPLEAMACGCPVVTSNVSSLPEVCGDASVYVDPCSIDSIADGMYSVLSNENLRKSMIEKGLERVKMFNWDRCAAETLKVFEEVYKK